MPTRTARRLLLAGVLTAGAVALGATPALAHECYVANRSTQGSTSASQHSSIWADSFSFAQFLEMPAPEGIEIPTLTAAQYDAAVALLASQKVPTVIAIGGGSPFELVCDPSGQTCSAPNPSGRTVTQANGTGGDIADRAPDARKADNRGIDHLGDNASVLFAWLAAAQQAAATVS